MGRGCFSYCTKLTSITLPNSITSLGNDCFSECSSLTSITLPNGITFLGEGCFSECTKLTSITLPKSIRHIYGGIKEVSSGSDEVNYLGDGSFKDCSNLSEVTCQWDNLDGIDVDNNTFDNIFSEAKLYIPKGTTAMYKAKKPWSNFKYIIEGKNTTGVLQIEKQREVLISTEGNNISISGLDDNEKVYLYNLQGMSLTEGTARAGTVNLNAGNERGIVIVKIGKQSIKVKLN